MKNRSLRWLQGLLRHALPSHCTLCESALIDAVSHPLLCDDCAHDLPLADSECLLCQVALSSPLTVRQHLCRNCHEESALSSLAVRFHYKEGIKSIIQQLKFNHRAELISLIASIMQPFFDHRITELTQKYRTPITLIPMPSDRFRLARRSFNPTLEILKKLCQGAPNSLIAFLPNYLHKYAFFIPQSELNRKERLDNLHGAFYINRALLPLVEGKNILLFDDVITTGTSLEISARTLINNGANSVHGMLIARA